SRKESTGKTRLSQQIGIWVTNCRSVTLLLLPGSAGLSAECRSLLDAAQEVAVTASRQDEQVDVDELRERARRENAELGPLPITARDREVWIEERRGAVALMAALADYSRERLRLAATSEWLEPGARQLLLDAGEQCG